MRKIAYFSFFCILIWSCSNTKSNINEEKQNDTLGLIDISQKIRKNPLNAALFYKRSIIYWSIQKVDSAINDAIIATRLDSMNDDYALNLASLYFNVLKIREANTVLENFLKRKPNSLKVLTRLGKYFSYLKDYRKAKEYIDKVLTIDPQYADAHFIKGVILTETNQPNQAIKAFLDVIQYNPEDIEAYMMLGLLYQELNDSIALQYYRTAARMNPKDPQPYYNIAYFYQENKNYAKAFENYNFILRNINNKYSNAFFNQGYIYMVYLNDYKKALSYFDSVLQLEPNRVEAIYNKGYCYEMMHDYISARSMYIKAKSIVENYELAIKGLNRIDKKIN
ncbi:MAG: tetratricopeptide repeat protein [Bacteroidales bacterium]